MILLETESHRNCRLCHFIEPLFADPVLSMLRFFMEFGLCLIPQDRHHSMQFAAKI
jgi:hypothetical protein